MYKAVSKAGVAQKEWRQPTEGIPPINRIAGTFSGTQNSGGSVLDWNGSATYVRGSPGPGSNGYFTLQSGHYTVVASGRDGTGGTACRQSGTKTVAGASGDLDIHSQGDSDGPPYGYSGGLLGQLPDSQIMMVTLHDCPQGAEDWEGQVVATSIAMAPWDTRGIRVLRRWGDLPRLRDGDQRSVHCDLDVGHDRVAVARLSSPSGGCRCARRS